MKVFIKLNFNDRFQLRYFLAVYPLNRDRHVMRVKSTDRDVVEPELMTGGLMEKYEDRCRWISASFNPTNDHVVINCRGLFHCFNWISYLKILE